MHSLTTKYQTLMKATDEQKAEGLSDLPDTKLFIWSKETPGGLTNIPGALQLQWGQSLQANVATTVWPC